MFSFNKTFVEADWASGNVTAPIPLDWHSGRAACQIVVTGTIQFDIQSSNSDLQAGASADWLADSPESEDITASKWITFNAIPRFIRLNVDSFTSGATVTLNWTQQDA